MSEEEKRDQEPTLSSTDEVRRVYEVGFHLIPSLSEEEVAQEVAFIKEAIERVGGEFSTEGYPKMRALEFTMEISGSNPKQKYDHAHFGWIKFDATPEAVEKLHEILAQRNTVIRMIIIKTVRENTLYGYRLRQQKKEAEQPEKDGKVSGKAEKPVAVSDEEIDKSIEELIVS